MKYALFLGCTIPARGRNYEISARKVAEKVGVDLVDVESFVCCGFPIKASNMDKSLVLGAYNLALAQEKGLDVCTLCSSCTSALTEIAHHLEKDEEAREKVNKSLLKVGLQYEGGVKVKHFGRILYEDVGPKEIQKYCERDLEELTLAVHYGCHYLKPSKIYGGFDSPQNPRTLDILMELTGARTVDYASKKKCCGGPILPVDEKTVFSIMQNKLDDVVRTGADAMCVACPFCAVIYDSNQKTLNSENGTTYDIPVLYFTQILGLAMGYDRKELGLNLNVVKTKNLLSEYFKAA